VLRKWLLLVTQQTEMGSDMAELAETPLAIAEAIIKAQYSARDKMLDIVLGAGVILLVVLAIKGYIGGWNGPNDGGIQGLNVIPNDDPRGIADVPASNLIANTPTAGTVYTYNRPYARGVLANNPGPSLTRPPANPSNYPDFDTNTDSN
jgi:hypothetical protein